MHSTDPFGRSGPRPAAKQLLILQTIRKLRQVHGRPPTMREVAHELDRKSVGGLSYQYGILEEMGYLRRSSGRPRAVEVRLPGEPDFPASAVLTAEAPALDDGRLDVVWVPMLGRISAGQPITAISAPAGQFPLPREVVGRGTLFMLRVVGDSMIGVGIMDGDWVVVRAQNDAEDGEIVTALIDGIEVEGTVKTLKEVDGHRWLMPQNPRYTPILGDQAQIRGKVVAVLRQVPQRLA